MNPLFFLVLITGIGNTVLRLEIENPYTLYRLIAPFGLIAVGVANPVLFLRSVLAFAAFFVYNFALATLYSSNYSELFPSIVHYFYLFIILVMMIHLRGRTSSFENSFIRFVFGFYVFLLANLIIEFFFGSYYPNLYVDSTDESSVRAFFWNQNDLAVILCVIAWFTLALDRFRGWPRFAVVVLTIIILYYNDSKAALLSFLFLSLPIYSVLQLCSLKRISPKIWLSLIAFFFFSAIAAIILFSDVTINFANDTYSLGDLLTRPIINILTLNSSGEDWGSLNNRTDAAIFVLIEYMRTFGLGLGAGGSWLVLTLPQYKLGGAMSPHNALLQFTVDFGYPVLLGYAWLIYWALRKLFIYRLDEFRRLKVIAILSFPMLGLSQSGAIVTNYFFFAAVYFIFLSRSPDIRKSPALPRRLKSDSPASAADRIEAFRPEGGPI